MILEPLHVDAVDRKNEVALGRDMWHSLHSACSPTRLSHNQEAENLSFFDKQHTAHLLLDAITRSDISKVPR